MLKTFVNSHPLLFNWNTWSFKISAILGTFKFPITETCLPTYPGHQIVPALWHIWLKAESFKLHICWRITYRDGTCRLARSWPPLPGRPTALHTAECANSHSRTSPDWAGRSPLSERHSRFHRNVERINRSRLFEVQCLGNKHTPQETSIIRPFVQSTSNDPFPRHAF